MPVAAYPAVAFIGADGDYVHLAGGGWGPGRLVRSGDRWVWQPEISLDREAFRDRARESPVVVAGLRVTDAGRARMLERLEHGGLPTMMTDLATRYGLDPGVLTWEEAADPVGRNNSRSVAYLACATGSDGRPAITGALLFFLPTGVAGDVLAIADLGISFEAVRPEYVMHSNGLAEIPVDLQVTGPELVTFLVQAWQTTTAILPLCAIADPADLSPAGPPHLELYIQNKHRPNSGQSRQVRTLDVIDLSRYGQPRQDPPGDLSVGVTTPVLPVREETAALTPRGPRPDDRGLRLHELPPSDAQRSRGR